jgi:hypothetical protein
MSPDVLFVNCFLRYLFLYLHMLYRTLKKTLLKCVRKLRRIVQLSLFFYKKKLTSCVIVCNLLSTLPVSVAVLFFDEKKNLSHPSIRTRLYRYRYLPSAIYVFF